ncbi:hypothetical protein KI387_001765, partial [Taxus chinensis]
MEMDFMGLSGNTNRTQMERHGNRQHPDDERDKELSLSLSHEAHKTGPGSGLQLSLSGKSKGCSVEGGDQVALNLGSSSPLRGTVVKVGNVTGSASFSAYNPEKQRSLLRFHGLPKGKILSGIENRHLNDKPKAVTVVATGKLPDNLAELDFQHQKPYSKDKAPVPNLSMQWQQLMSIKNAQEDRPAKRKFDWLAKPVPTADAFKPNKRSTVASQKSYNFSPTSNDTPESRNFYSVANGNLNQHFGAFPATFSPRTFDDWSSSDYCYDQAQSFLTVKSSHLLSNVNECLVSPLKEQPAANSSQPHFSSIPSTSQASVWAGSNVPHKLGNAQLTIFYAGNVNVYENIPPEKAHEIMLMAGSVNSVHAMGTDSSTHQRFKMSAPLATEGHSRPATPTICSSLPNALTSMSPQSATQMCNMFVPQVHPQKSQISSQPGPSTASFSGDGEFETNHSIESASGQQEPAKQLVSGLAPTVARRALPQARKASLTRFLERRKE